MINMLVYDLDDTMLNKKGQISDKNAQILRVARKLGVIDVAASGRTPEEIKKVFKNANIENSWYIIGDNGGIITDNDGEIIRKKNILTDAAVKILEIYMKNFDAGTIRITDGKNVLSHSDVRVWDFYKAKENLEILVPVPNLVEHVKKHDCIKIVFSVPEQSLEHLGKELQQQFNVAVHKSGPTKLGKGLQKLEITQKDTCKAEAVNYLIKNCINNANINILAIGDQMNDCSMLLYAIDRGGYAAVMENGKKELKRIISEYARSFNRPEAYFEAPSNDKDGAAIAIIRWIQMLGINMYMQPVSCNKKF